MTSEELSKLAKDPEQLMDAVGNLIKGLSVFAAQYKDEIEERKVDLSLLAAGFSTAITHERNGEEISRFLQTVIVSAYLIGRQDEQEVGIKTVKMFEPLKVTVGANPWPTLED